MNEEYYLHLRNKYRPKNLKIVFVVESPPASGQYFYDEDGSVSEPLFFAMMKLLKFNPQNKRDGLCYFAESGHFLVDATYEPVNKFTGKIRENKILKNFENLVADLKKLGDPKKINIILIKANICHLLEPRLLSSGFNVQNNGMVIPFPTHGHQNRFLSQTQKVIGGLTENSSIAAEIKQKNVIDMALTFTAMIRLFEKGSKPKIADKLYQEFQRLEKIKDIKEFQEFHRVFSDWFTSNIKTAQKERNSKIVKKSGYALYGHAAKLLDVSLKVYVYYSSLPNKHTAETILPFLNSAIDNPILNHLKKSFPNEFVLPKTVEQIDKNTYKNLQKLIRSDIKKNFNNHILPTQYDDIMWHRLNR